MTRQVEPVVPWSIARTHFIREGIWSAIHALVGHHAGDEFGGGDVERGIAAIHIGRRSGDAGEASHLGGGALLDDDRLAVRRRMGDARPGRADVPILFAVSPFEATRSAPTSTTSISRARMRLADMASVSTVMAMPARPSSQAVRRLPRSSGGG